MFRRRKADVDAVDETGRAGEEGEDVAPVDDRRANGPWDRSEVEIDEDDESRIDLGSLLITPHDGLDVQLQVDESTGEVAAVFLAGQEGACDLRVFAAPRHGDIWDDVRKGVAAGVAQMGGTATERSGEWGTELLVSLMVELPDGQQGRQDSRVVGIAGPRWLLRVTFFGRPADRYEVDGDIETALRDVVVVRGSGPVPPADPLPLTMPPGAEPAGV